MAQPERISPWKLATLTVAALTGFAANSLLCRAALADDGRLIDPATFTLLRLASGALVLAALTFRPGRALGGSWRAAGALFLYAAAFSLAYVRIPAGVGALLLFGTVQVTMLGFGLARGERPRRRTWIGIALALGGLVAMNLPGLSAPDLIGSALMTVAGIAWGAYSLLGRRSTSAAADTAGNFARALPLAIGLSAASALSGAAPHLSSSGVGLAVASGALASGLGYALWYSALPSLTATRAAIVQLAVPVLAATGGVLLLGELASARLVFSGAALLAGVLIAVTARSEARRAR